MVPIREFLLNLDVVHQVTRNTQLLDGAIVECGTWRGGMSAALIEVAGAHREYHFFDSFEGLPPAKPIDGPAALAWQRDTTSPFFHDNCTASLEDFQHAIAMTGVSTHQIHVHAGFFDQTLPGLTMPPIAVLRLDADWYESTMLCLESLFDKVMPGGVVIIDDYYAWDGCSRAVHDFLSRTQSPARIWQKSNVLAIIVKGPIELEPGGPGSIDPQSLARPLP
jgi:O-methyltransferase